MLRKARYLAGLIGACLALAGAAAEKYPDPSRPIRLIVPFAPGGTSDIVARVMAPRLSEILGAPVVVENKAGAAGNIAADYVAKARPDGYTVLVANNTIVTNPALGKVPYDVVTDFAPIAMVGSIPIALAVHRSLPVATTAELVSFLRKNPGKYAFSSCGAGTAQHFAGELFKRQAQLDLVHVGYKGCGLAVVDGVSGQVPILFNAISVVQPHAHAGGPLKILAVTSAERSSLDKSIQTIAEAGMKDFDAQVWFGFMAPANTPAALRQTLEQAIASVIKAPDVQEKLKASAFDAQFTGPAQFSRVIASDLVKWSKLAREAQIQVQN